MAGCCAITSPDPRYRCRLVVMVKLPRAGRVKTRLAKGIGAVRATWWMRWQLRHLRRLIDPRWELVLAVAPDVAVGAPEFLRAVPRVAQGAGDLGDRMARIFRQLPPGPVCIIGADIPDISRAHVARAFTALGQSEAVFGPASDGGYWLVGMRRVRGVPANLFSGVTWSSPQTLAQSIASLRGRSVHLVDQLDDVDDVADLQAIAGRRAVRAR